MNTNQIHKISWMGIPISVSYQPDYSKAFQGIMGEKLALIEVKAEEVLPITETGYRRLFILHTEVEKNGGAILLVQTWLEKASHSPEWKEYVREKKQLKLF